MSAYDISVEVDMDNAMATSMVVVSGTDLWCIMLKV